MSRRKSSLGDGADAWGPSKRGDTETDLDITPMIDVTFLLLIFFMVTSTMKPPTDLDVPPAQHGLGVETGGAMIVSILKPDASGLPRIEFEREVTGSEGTTKDKTEDATLDQVREFIQTEMKENHKSEVIIKADREVTHGFVQQVAKVVVEFEGVTFSIAVRDKN